MRSGFIDKLIERIRRVQPEEVQNYLVRLAREKGFLERIFDALQEGVIVTDVTRQDPIYKRCRCSAFRG